MGYLDRRAYWRLAHFERGCGAAVSRRAISVCDSCFAFLLSIRSAMRSLSLYPAQHAVTKSDSFPLIQTRGEGVAFENPKQLLTRLEISFELGMRQTNRRTGEADERSNIFGSC
jgi:hypothetical protein